MAYNFSAQTNGPLIYNGENCELTPQRGTINNNKELFWFEPDLAQPIANTRAVLYVCINDVLLNLNFQYFNHMGNDACNRYDQCSRSAANFMVMELREMLKFFKKYKA